MSKNIKHPPEKPYFELANEFIELNRKFNPEDALSKISLWADMIIHPIYTIVSWIISGFSAWSLMGLYKTYELWIDWLRWKELIWIVREWTLYVRSFGGPWISSNDAEYHIYVYADGMTRLSTCKKVVKFTTPT